MPHPGPDSGPSLSPRSPQCVQLSLTALSDESAVAHHGDKPLPEDFGTELIQPRQLTASELANLRVLNRETGELLVATTAGATLTVDGLKQLVESEHGIPPKKQLLSYCGVPLCGGENLRERCNLNVIELALRVVEEAWTEALEEANRGRSVASELRGKLRREADYAHKQLKRHKVRLKGLASEMKNRFMEATSMLSASSVSLLAKAGDLQQNRDVVFEVVPRSAKGCRQAAEELMHCRNALLGSAKMNGEVLMESTETLKEPHRNLTACLSHAASSLASFRELVHREGELMCLENARGRLTGAASAWLLQNFEAMQTVLETDGIQLAEMVQDLLSQRQAYRRAVAQNREAIKHAEMNLQHDQDVVFSWALNHVSKGRTLDRDFIMNVVQANGEALEQAPPELRGDRELVTLAVQSSAGWALQFASEELRADREIVLSAVRRNGLALEFAAPALKRDRAVAMAAVQGEGEALQFASAALCGDRELVALAVRRSAGWALQFAAEELRDDLELVLGAVQANGLALQHASEGLRGQRDLVEVAMKSNPGALEFASKDLKDDKELVMTAVRKDGSSLRFASDALRADREVVEEGVRQAGSYVLMLANEELRDDPELLELCTQVRTSRRYPDSESSEGVVVRAWSDAENNWERLKL